MTECSHGMPSPASCTDCMYEGELAPPPKPAPATIDSVFRASYEGQCPGCDLPIDVGQRIARMSNGGYLHFDCAQ
jgi:hypothetical protein